MRIATMVTGCMATPQPRGITYAPMDIAVAISEGLHALGHQVEYYGPEGTKANVPVVTCGLEPFELDVGGRYSYPAAQDEVPNLTRMWDEYLIAEMFRRADRGDYDALLIHPIDRGLVFAQMFPNVPVAYVLHDPIVKWRQDIYHRFLSKNQHLISITNAQRAPAPDLPYLATIYNGINTDMFSFVDTPEDHVLFSGRMIPSKNPIGAIEAARKAGVPIKLFGQISPEAPLYFVTEVEKYLGGDAMYEGFLDRAQLAQQYGRAKALLAPIQWEEPFGLVFIEAMACGTPVIAFRRGSVPEIIIDGKTGFIVDTIEEMAEAIKKIDTIDRQACRQHVLDKFSNQQMVKGYEAALGQLVASV